MFVLIPNCVIKIGPAAPVAEGIFAITLQLYFRLRIFRRYFEVKKK